MAVPSGSMSLSYTRVFDRFYIDAQYSADDYDYVEFQMNSNEPWVTVPKSDFESWPIETPALTAWSTFEFRARAVNADGPGTAGLLSLSTTGVTPGPVSAPAGSLVVTDAVRVSDTSNRLEWTYDASDVAYYRIKKTDGSDNQYSFDKNFTLSDLVTGDTISYEVVAYNSHGEGSPDTATFVAGSTGLIGGNPPVGTVTVNAAQNVTHNSASLPFTYSDSDQTGFEYRIDSGTPISIASSPISLTGLSAETTYSVEVRAVNASGSGAWSAAQSFTTSAAPALPPQGTVTLNAGTITVTETTATVPVQYSDSDQTGFEYRLDGGSPVAFSESPAVISGLTADTTYSIEVRAVNTNGSSAWSSSVNFTTQAAPALPPQGTSTIDVANGTIGYNSASFPYSYDASDANAHEYSLDDGAPVAFDGVTINIPNLSPETSHTLKARAKNDDGDGAWSPVVNFTTTAVPVSPPASVPANISIVTTTTSATITFTYPGGDADSYEYQIDGGAWVEIQATSFQIDNLAPDATYELSGIRAKNSAGVGNASPAQDFTTQAAQRGVLGSEIPSTGEDGPSILYPHINLPADANVRFYVEAVNALPPGMTLQDNGVLTWDAVAAGRTEIQVRAYRDGVEWTPENTNNLVVITGT